MRINLFPRAVSALSRRWRAIALCVSALAGLTLGSEFFAFATHRPTEKLGHSERITILGTAYSPRLGRLCEKVSRQYQKPVTFEPIEGHKDNSTLVRDKDILVSLRPGSSEDDVAHELMHSVLQFEGYPRIFGISAGNTAQLSRSIRDILVSDLDHLLINQRLCRSVTMPVTVFSLMQIGMTGSAELWNSSGGFTFQAIRTKEP